MHSRPFRSLFAVGFASLLMFSFANVADAAGKDADAAKAMDKAMDDYLNTKFDDAIKKIKTAIKNCGSCSAETQGKLHVLLGTIYGAGQSNLSDAQSEFSAALKADPGAKLDPSLSNDDLKKAFAAAKKGGGKSSGGDDDEEEKPKKPKKAAGGDLSYTPPTEGQVNTPLAIAIEIPEDLEAKKVTLHYKGFGATEYKTVELKKLGKKWGGLIPCEEVSTTGDLKFYIIAKDDSGDDAGSAGSKTAPYTVTIKNEVDEVPALPGQDPPKQCKAKEDCPPGLPGCKDQNAATGDQAPIGAACETKSDCNSGEDCVDGHCKAGEAPSGNAKRNLVTLTGGLDMLVISGQDDGVCSGTNASYSCFYQDGSGQFYGVPAERSGTNGIQGGFSIAGGRILASYDRQLGHGGFMLGLRAGYAFGGSPSSPNQPVNNNASTNALNASKVWDGSQAKSFMPIHAELRATYHLGGDGVLEAKKFKPYFFLGGGLAQVNGSVPVDICDQLDAQGNVETMKSKDCNGAKTINGAGARAVTVDAYQITGLNFVGLGAGGVFGLTPTFGIAAEIKVMFMVPTFGVVFAPSLGPAIAF